MPLLSTQWHCHLCKQNKPSQLTQPPRRLQTLLHQPQIIRSHGSHNIHRVEGPPYRASKRFYHFGQPTECTRRWRFGLASSRICRYVRRSDATGESRCGEGSSGEESTGHTEAEGLLVQQLRVDQCSDFQGRAIQEAASLREGWRGEGFGARVCGEMSAFEALCIKLSSRGRFRREQLLPNDGQGCGAGGMLCRCLVIDYVAPG
jgi:hypothetical protein